MTSWRGKGGGDLLHFVKLAKRSLKGKGDGAGQGIVRFWEGWCGARGYRSFAMVVGMERFGATGGASPSPYEKRVG